MIYIRPHHINCIYFFKGVGYSDEYVREMKKIITYLENNSNEEFKFIIACDEICKACPRRAQNICINEEMVVKMDVNTIKKYRLNLDKTYTFGKIKEKFYKNFNFAKCEEICGDCEWRMLGFCSNYVNNIISKIK